MRLSKTLKLSQVDWSTIATVTVPFIILTSLYSLTVSRQLVGYADAPDLLMASLFNGKAHPPSYSLLTIPLHQILSMFPTNPFLTSNIYNAIIQSIAASIMALILFKISTHVYFLKQSIAVCIAITSALIWGLAAFNWQHAVVLEVFALSNLLVFTAIYFNQSFFYSPSSKKLFLGFFFWGCAIAYHPLNTLIFIPFTLLFSKSITKRFINRAVLGILSGFVVLAYILPFANINQSYSWVSEWGMRQALATYARTIYQAGGSAVETYLTQINIGHSIQSLLFLFTQLAFSIEITMLILTTFGLILVKKTNFAVFRTLLFAMLLSGPLLVILMKFPLLNQVHDLEYFFGTALRWRMLNPFFSMVGIASGLGAIALYHYFSLTSRRIFLVIYLLVPLVFLSINWSGSDASQDNFTQLFTTTILSSLPQDSLLLIDHDEAFSLLAASLINNVRPDITIVPLTFSVQPSKSATLVSKFGPLDTSSLALFGLDLSLKAIKQEVPVFWLISDASLYQWLGVEGNPFYLRPFGYLTQISDTPLQILDYDYGLSQSLIEFQSTISPNDWWSQGLMAYMASIHTRLAYYHARLGNQSGAQAHHNLALDLSHSPLSRRVISSSLEEGKYRYQQLGRFDQLEPQSSNSYWTTYLKSEQSQKEYWLTRAIITSFLDNNPLPITTDDLALIQNQSLRNYMTTLAGIGRFSR